MLRFFSVSVSLNLKEESDRLWLPSGLQSRGYSCQESGEFLQSFKSKPTKPCRLKCHIKCSQYSITSSNLNLSHYSSFFWRGASGTKIILETLRQNSHVFLIKWSHGWHWRRKSLKGLLIAHQHHNNKVHLNILCLPLDTIGFTAWACDASVHHQVFFF